MRKVKIFVKVFDHFQHFANANGIFSDTVIYANINLFVWLLLYSSDLTGAGILEDNNRENKIEKGKIKTNGLLLPL